MIILPSKFGYKTVQLFTTFPKIIRLQNVALNKLPNYGIFKKTGYLVLISEEQGQIKGEGAGVWTPSPDMTCSFLIQLVFCIKICLCLHSVTPFLSDALPPKKNPGSAPKDDE